ncbi:Sterol regulatory element-binding protein 1 [Madurella mycetomatis]|uniref:Sterol regulatory element-binding protein 1 n=1 Tax=Madurella mycetomatis TaxID=100816 RepID=A0A175VUL9_9PEZI|nr:Sterol regulatory element-binding protein 1 [Madurella mycetomatis]
MANQDADSPCLFDGLGTFDLGDDTLGDSGLTDGLADSGLGTSGPNTAAAAVASPTVDESVPATTGLDGSGPASVSQSAVTAPQQPDFFNPVSSNWVFQNTPPYDSPIGENPFGAAPQQSWELPVHTNLNQTLLRQQSLYLHSPDSPAVDSSTGSATATTTGANAPIIPTFAPNAEAIRAENQRNIQNTLTPAQRERLKTIAMPPHLQYHSPKSAGSPDSNSSHDKGAASSPDAAGPSKSNSRKRKSSAEVDEDDDDDELDGQQPVKKTAHNMIEKRYRTNLNDKIAALRDSVPSLRIMSKSARGEDTTEDREELHGLTPAHKLNKATVLSKATEYIRHLEKRNNRLIEENNSMQARIAAFEKLFMAGAITGQLPNPLQQPPTPIQYPQDPAYMNTPVAAPGGPDPPGMIPIPDDMKRILTSQQMNAGRPYPVPAQHFGQNPAILRQQQIQQQQQQQQAQASRWNPYFGKLMVGSLAGLMLVEALVENEQSTETTEGRGLFGLPVHFLAAFVRSTHFSIGGYHISAISLIAKLRLLSLAGFFLWAACSSFIDMSIFESSKSSKHSAAMVQAVPSLASPIHVRRQAWLTAVQTVWVPRHNFFLEAAALLLKTAKYALRNVIGSHGYLALTGLSEEEEAARVKAWSIALDAQLAGGDMEINKSRLTLTLIASGTLPDTPLRLMMKALHIRVLLWQLNGASWAANLVAAKLARSRWNEARQLNRILNSLQEEQTSDETLPEHLATLLEQDCDEVLNDGIIQRAHNLAWNQHTTYNMIGKVDGMDAVVEDAAVRSPMDAVAAWYSSITLHRALVDSLSNPRDDDVSAMIADDIALAVQVAPIGSNAQVRALVARAVFVDGKRGANIVAAMQALGPSLNPDKHPQYSSGVPPLIDSPMSSITPDPDAQMALRCAMGIAQLQKFTYLLHPAAMVIDSILPSQEAVEDMSLLGYAAAFRLMERLYYHAVGRERCSGSLERLAGSLRIWIGSSAGDKAGSMRQ